MRIKPLRNLLIATTGVSFVMIAAVGGWALLSGSGDKIDATISSASIPVTPGSPTNVGKEPKSFDHLWNVTLQEPRIQQTTQAPQPTMVKPANVAFGIKLVGTMIEPTRTLALFQDNRGAFDLKGVGEPLALTPAGAQIETIKSGLATLRYEGREIQLPLATSSTPVQRQNYFNGMSAEVADAPEVMEPEPTERPIDFMTPASPEDGVPGGEDDPFAPLPAHMNPYGSPSPSSPMEPRL